MRQNTLEYLAVTFFGIFVAVVTALVSLYVKLDLGEALILIFVSEIFMIEITNYVLMKRPKARRVIQVLRGENKIFKKAISMQKKAKAEICASWGFPRYTSSLENYFREITERLKEKSEVKIHRVINIQEVGTDRVKQHLVRNLDMLRDRRYIVHSTFHKAFEYLVVDRAEALFLAPHTVREGLDMGIHGEDESFVHCLIELFGDLRDKGVRLKIPETKSEDELKAHIYRWVDSQVKQA